MMKNHLTPARILLFALPILFCSLLGPEAALAQCGSPAMSSIPTAFPVCPSGDLPMRVIIRDTGGNPCPGEPITMVINGCSCGPTTYTSLTNASGVATFSPSMGGFCSMPLLAIFLGGSGLVLGSANLVNSPDMNGDCSVNLTDIGMFAQAYATGLVAPIDFNLDGIVNLADIVLMAGHIGH